MINVDKIYQRVLTLANKEQRGYITPQEFNILANQAQMDIFEQYFYDLNQFLRTPGNSTVHADMVDMLEEKISVFETSAIITVAGNIASLNDVDRFYRLSTVRDGNVTYENITKKEARLFENSLLAKATNSRPTYIMDGVKNNITLFGRTPTLINVDYITSPKQAKWTYVVVNNKALHNSTAEDKQDFQLHASEETDLVLKILTLAGFTLKDPNLYQAAASEDMKSVQQEKQ